MSAFDRALASAKMAQRESFGVSLDLDAKHAARNVALAQAWKHRPRGVTWSELARLVNEGLPEGAKVSVSTLRWAARAGNGGSTPERAE